MRTSRSNVIFGAIVVALAVFTFVDYFEVLPGRVCFLEKNSGGSKHNKHENDFTKTKSQQILTRNVCDGDFKDQTIYETNSHPLPNITLPGNSTNWEDLCSGENAYFCVPKFKSVQRSYKYSKPTKTVNCLVHKSMSTIFKTLSCFLDDPLKFLYYGNDLLDYEHWQVRGEGNEQCAQFYHTNGFNSIEQGELNHTVTASKGYQYTMVVRDPLDRFLSGYIHFCYKGHIVDCARYCNYCESNLTCFLEKEVQKMYSVARNASEINLMTNHLIPQNWQCELKENFNKYKFLRYNSNSSIFFDQELGPYLESRNVSADALHYVRTRLTSARTKHSTSNLGVKPFLEKRIRESPYLMQLILRLFYHDYKVFGFEFPKFVS